MHETKWLDPNKPSRTYTIGYGLTTQDEFADRLKEAFPDGDAVIIDVRKEGSGSRNAGNWADWGYCGIGDTVILAGYTYISMPALANPHGNTPKGLMLYRDELIDGSRRPHLDKLVAMMKASDNPYCLLCCERKPFAGTFTPKRIVDGVPIGWESWTGKPNCHRVTIAKQIHMRMRIDHGLEWFTKHLYTEGR